MKDTVTQYLGKRRQRKSRRKKAAAVLLTLSVMVAGGTTWSLHRTGESLAKEAYCGHEEHTHSETCYEKVLTCTLEEGETHTHGDGCYEEQQTLTCAQAEHVHSAEAGCYIEETTLVCGQEESAGHTHSEACYDEEGNLICGQEESAGHTHSEACYQTTQTLVCTTPEHTHSAEAGCYTTEKVLTCTLEETEGHTHTDECYEEQLTCGYEEEHTHTLACYSNPNADLESSSVWSASVSGASLTGEAGKDVVAVAKTQIGYTESSANYAVSTAADGTETKKGYSRYGAWYGDPYGDWCAMFASFCLRYANVDYPIEASCSNWVSTLSASGRYVSKGAWTAAVGDLVFFDKNGDGASDHMGIVSAVSENSIETIEGNCGNKVAQKSYSRSDGSILGYGVLPVKETETTEAASTEATEGAAEETAAPTEAEGTASGTAEAAADSTEETEAAEDPIYDTTAAAEEPAGAADNNIEETPSEETSGDGTEGTAEEASGETTETASEETTEGTTEEATEETTEETAGGSQEEKTLTCTQEEHVHSEEAGCYDGDGNLTCTTEEHTHGEECYAAEETEKSGIKTKTAECDGYSVTVVYGEDAEIPDEAELVVKPTDLTISADEIEEIMGAEETEDGESDADGTSGQDGDQAKASSESGNENTDEEDTSEEVTPLVCLDISFVLNGVEIEPKSIVDVKVTAVGGLGLEDDTELTVIHFKEDGSKELIENVDVEESGDADEEIAFQMSSFSGIMIIKGWDDHRGDNNNNNDQECDISYYNSNAQIYWDTMTYNESTRSGSANHGAYTHISSVTLSEQTVINANSGDTGWEGGTTASTYFSGASKTNNVETSLVITPASGYYVTRVVVACTGRGGDTSPYDCNTWSEGNAFSEGFTYTASGATTIAVSAKDFSHKSESSNYFILIQVAPIPSPLYVEYDYGDIVSYIENGTHDAFETARGWTSLGSGNSYGTGDVQTENTQMKYAYAEGLSDNEKAAAVANWKHTTNSITKEAAEQAAAAGYYFAGWSYTYYGETSVSENASGSYNNYTYNFSESVGSGSIGEGETLTLQTNVKLVAQWEPITLTVKKIVMIDDYEDSNGVIADSFAITVKSGADTYKSLTMSTATDGLTTTLSPVPAGTYTVEETTPDNYTTEDTTYYFDKSVVSEGVTLSSSEGARTGTITVTNYYTTTVPTFNITIVKKVEGSAPEDASFAFTVSSDKGYTEYTVNETNQGAPTETGNSTYLAKGSLAKNKTIVLTGVQKGTTLNIYEEGAENYTTTAKAIVGNAESTIVVNEGTDTTTTDMKTLASYEVSGAATITVTNQYDPTPADLTLTKVDSTNASTTLGGAEFTLYNSTTKEYWTGYDLTTGSATWSGTAPTDAVLVSGTNGEISVLGLKDGSYILTETKAPDGYNLMESTITFTVSGGKIINVCKGNTVLNATGGNTRDKATLRYTYALNVTNSKGVALPNTGGPGTIMFTLGGLALIMGGALVYGCGLRRRRERRLK